MKQPRKDTSMSSDGGSLREYQTIYFCSFWGGAAIAVFHAATALNTERGLADFGSDPEGCDPPSAGLDDRDYKPAGEPAVGRKARYMSARWHDYGPEPYR
jgi:hypothetical protein